MVMVMEIVVTVMATLPMVEYVHEFHIGQKSLCGLRRLSILFGSHNMMQHLQNDAMYHGDGMVTVMVMVMVMVMVSYLIPSIIGMLLQLL